MQARFWGACIIFWSKASKPLRIYNWEKSCSKASFNKIFTIFVLDKSLFIMNNTHIPNLMAVHIYTLAYHILTIVGGVWC